MEVFISGQKYFGESVYFLCKKLGFKIVGVCAPIGDKYLYKVAVRDGVMIIPAGALNAENMPACDLGITAHSFDYIGKKTGATSHIRTGAGYLKNISSTQRRERRSYGVTNCWEWASDYTKPR